MLAGLSSTIKIVAISGSFISPGHCAPNLGAEVFEFEFCFGQDCGHVTIELVALLDSQLHRSEHHDWDLGGGRVSTQLLDQIETADVRHHQIEHDQVWRLAAHRGDTLAATV